ncbi:MAG: AAA family ATPase [Bacteroidia bacterium]|nr:AAA family ATPase [Bacteroidia bacterium]MCZ2249706.1 AAA family ATPase [Bacteroidia bacterium]
MKILNLKFKNINSLSGENEIDFTRPEFTNNGLFAITGKTGAGKSSILDAISLALYGKTPRVDITGSENAVMTKGEKDCYAEIIFEVADKKWKSSWKQERNSKGKLKLIHRAIADFENKIIADQVRACETEIVKIIGLSFEQFTKVVMLAQGSFAAFLQADKNDKGALLEQITGTEIYAEISKIVFDRHKTEKEKLDKIFLELQAIKTLSEEEIEALKNENSEIEKEKKIIDEELQKVEKAKKWLNDISILQANIDEASKKLPELETQIVSKQQIFEEAESSLKSVKEEKKKQELVFNKVRELDTKISEKEKLLNPLLYSISKTQEEREKVSKNLENIRVKLEKYEKISIEKQQWISLNKKYETLASNYSAIEKVNESLLTSQNEINKEDSEIAELIKDFGVKKTEAEKAKSVFDNKTNSLTEKTKELELKKYELKELLGGKNLYELQNEKESLTNFGIHIKKLIEVESSILTSQKEIDDMNIKLKQIESIREVLVLMIDDEKKSIENLETKTNLLEENVKLIKTIESLDDHRHQLKDGEECPLCGALEHPFAKGNMPKIGEKEKELASLKQQRQTLTKAYQQNENKLSALIADYENVIKNKVKEEKVIAEKWQKKSEIIDELKNIDASYNYLNEENKTEKLENVLADVKEKYKEINSLITKVTNKELLISTIRDKEILILQKEKEEAQKLKDDLEKIIGIKEAQIKTKQEETKKKQEKYLADNTTFLQTLNTYSAENIETLKKHLNTWNENVSMLDKLTLEISSLKNTIAIDYQNFENLTKLFNDRQKDKTDIETEKQKLLNLRKEIFQEKVVEDEESCLNKIIEETEQRKIKAEKEKIETNTEYEKNKAIVIEKKTELLEIQKLQLTNKTNEELQIKSLELKGKADEYSQKVGANNQVLKSNEESLKSSGKKIEEKVKQQVIYNKWAKLNVLIGSSDGKYYRNFAQTLTFEYLVSLANRQLIKMSDRYMLKLIDDKSNPFELYVIDKYQNNEERTAKNLSGGEKFIVSLSLALGLANMASKSMRIDTMFIDEGFGTLDSDYLDVALNALSNLQSEGKIIGVISHLSELKERIAIHIEVIQGGNGHSKIQITG